MKDHQTFNMINTQNEQMQNENQEEVPNNSKEEYKVNNLKSWEISAENHIKKVKNGEIKGEKYIGK